MIERKDARKTLALGTKFRTQQDRRDVLITDLSRHGCRVAAQGLWLPVGQVVVLRPQGMEIMPGTVRWASTGLAGIEFDLPLHPAVVDHLCRMHPDQNAIELELAA